MDAAARALGLHEVFEAAGFEWKAGLFDVLAMNPDKLVGDEVCASSSNRNFMGRQGSSTGRTILMSPIMVAAAAVKALSQMPERYLNWRSMSELTRLLVGASM